MSQITCLNCKQTKSQPKTELVNKQNWCAECVNDHHAKYGGKLKSDV